MSMISTNEEKIELIKQKIIETVSQLQGCKDIELLVRVTEWLFTQNEDLPIDFVVQGFVLGLIEELIKKGELIEIRYSLPMMDYRDKSLLLPKGSVITNWKENNF